MKEQIDSLINLQTIEKDTENIKSVLNDVSKRTETLDVKIGMFQKEIECDELELEGLQIKYRSWESDAQLYLSRVKKSETNLRSVKTNKEYQAILKEIDDLKAKISQIEDEMLECLDRMDDFGNAIAAKRKEYKDLIEITNQEKQTIEHDAAEKMKLLGQLEMDRNRASKIIDPKLLSKYTVIKDIVKIMAIAPVKDAVCRGCNLNIPPQMYNELQKGDDLRFCPNCQRMIYWDNS
ncbi:MAG: C4-type zinc ribbon domain-containing protein [Desulfobacterales bacterium]|jgi:hypothetical protein|nr:hypothetical protein [Desulfobacter sp.]MDP6395647.1 C4-type zinc ribbon domain-containing protein [Desulfobacterales bacterium]MDP6681795.1 C4-type zinc ribbon domain-containing protein [Desulfobacterales bacterium]MDP6807994.1 C4-type zinc ribbon domain-containing protein [Desulfobacterales bacterium]|tara:strand:- start:13855 stop:14562 length:708 start_codon:yes stop_codon:yes gene_type:complete